MRCVEREGRFVVLTRRMIRSPDNGMVTPAMKLARPYISKTYAKEIEVSL